MGDAELELHDSQWDELKSILPVEKVLGGYYRELGVTFNGGELIADRSTPTVRRRPSNYGTDGLADVTPTPAERHTSWASSAMSDLTRM
jgi:hypothetical protein